ncbi:MAG: allantoinase AllB [Planctomycetota bacterium]|jgi:allantoinase|nr:allantoinase AllB [Planctomycetota bacterium]
MYDLKITNARIVTPDRIYRGDILVRDGKIAAVGDCAEATAKETLDAAGKFAFPGMIDSHAHLNDPGYCWREDFPHGSAAAVVGGVTTIVDMPLQNEPALINAKIFADKAAALAGRSLADYAFWGGLVDDNSDDLEGMHDAGAVAFKAFIGPVSPDYSSINMGLVRKALGILKRIDALGGFHCEDYSIIKAAEKEVERRVGKNASWTDFLASRPVSAEIISTRSIIDLARETGARVHICHVSHPEVAEIIRQARCDGVQVSGETCPHYLTFTGEDVVKNGCTFKCAPPLRDAEAREKLWGYVLDGTLGCIGSDHSPCRADEKDDAVHGVFGAWGGISGIQNMMQVFYDQGINRRGHSPTLLARVSAETAKVFSLGDHKGRLEPGFDADIVLLDPEKNWEVTPESLRYVNPISAFIGLTGRGLPVLTMVRGVVVARDGQPENLYSHGKLAKRGI